jgi:Tfp pilus assembly protein PilO
MRRNLLKGINIKKLSRAQKKALAISVVVVLVFIVLWLFTYIPARNTVKKLKVELAGVDGQIKQIEERLGHSRSLDEGIKLLEADLKNLKNRFPSKEEESIKALASFAQKSGINVDSIRPLPREELLDQNGSPVKIKGKDCHVISVAVVMKCSFADLVKFTEIIEKKLPAFAIIQKLNINTNPVNLQILSVSMDLNLYLLAAN